FTSDSLCFFFSSRRRHTRSKRDWSSDVCSSDLPVTATALATVTMGMALGMVTMATAPVTAMVPVMATAPVTEMAVKTAKTLETMTAPGIVLVTLKNLVMHLKTSKI